jgi:hypothetical protein
MTSVDAVMTLLPAGAYWLLGAGKELPDEPLFGAQIFRPSGEVIGQAETDTSPASALLAAVLRAHAAESDRE